MSTNLLNCMNCNEMLASHPHVFFVLNVFVVFWTFLKAFFSEIADLPTSTCRFCLKGLFSSSAIQEVSKIPHSNQMTFSLLE